MPLDEVEDPVAVDAPVPVDDDATVEPAAPVAEPCRSTPSSRTAPVEPIEVVVEPPPDAPVDGIDERVEDEAR